MMERRQKWAERVWTRLAWWLPRPLVYWAAIRLVSYATVGIYQHQDPTTLTVMEALKRWEQAGEGEDTTQQPAAWADDL